MIIDITNDTRLKSCNRFVIEINHHHHHHLFNISFSD